MERELKLRLSAAEAERLGVFLGTPLTTILQVNYYFDDSSESLRSRHQLLRLREETDMNGRRQYTLALKGPSRMEGVIAARTEREVAVDGQWAREVITSGIALSNLPLDALDLPASELAGDPAAHHLYSHGSLRNERRLYDPALLFADVSIPAESIEFALDQTQFPDQSIDYEAELELIPSMTAFPEGCLDAVRFAFRKLEINWAPGNSSKFSRWLQRRGKP
jgi:uncharacterized protein YjbK